MADPLPLARTPAGLGTWAGLVGVQGGIPTRNTIYQTLSPGATTGQIQTAIDNCPSGQVVFLGAGTYNINHLTINRSNMTLRGAVDANGAPTTIINTGDTHGVIVGNLSWLNDWQTPSAANARSWTAGFAQGTTVITVSSTTGMTVGDLIFLDQLNDADTTADSPANPNGPYVTGEYTSVLHPQQGYERIQFQVNRISAINGNDITLYEPLYMPNWDSGLTPQVWFEPLATLPIEYVGVENLDITVTPSDACVFLSYIYSCWVTNCRCSQGTTAHLGAIFMWQCLRPEIKHNYLHDTGVADRYGIHTRMVAGALIENNIVDGHITMCMINGVSGSVYAYNFTINQDQNSGFMVQSLLTHGGTPNMCLFEGNYSPQWGLDSQWQNSAYMVAHRNRFLGKDISGNATGNIQAVCIMEMHHHATMIGNVLGVLGYNTWYQDDGTTASHDGSRVYYLGLRFGGSGNAGVYDSDVIATLIRAVNWDSANNAIVGGGYSTSDLLSSYYLTSKPAFFGNLAWPAFDPVAPSATYVAIPAGYRYANGFDPPVAPLMSSFTIAASGASATIVFSASVSIGSGGSAGWLASISGGLITLTYASGSGSTTLIYTIGTRIVKSGETGTIAYTQPGDGIEDGSGNDLSTFSGTAVTNNSTQPSASGSVINVTTLNVTTLRIG